MRNTLTKTLTFLNRRDREKAIGLLFMMVIAASLEVVGIGLLMPFIGLISSPENIGTAGTLRKIYNSFGAPPYPVFLAYSGGFLICLFIVKSVFTVLLSVVQGKYLLSRQRDLEERLFSSYLKQTYTFHLQRNPAELFQNVRCVSGVVNCVMLPVLTLTSELLVSIFMMALLIAYKPALTLGAIGVLGGCGSLFYFFVKRKTRIYGEIQRDSGIQYVKWMNQGLGGIKEIKVLGKEDFFITLAIQHSYTYGKAVMQSLVLNQLSRPLVEVVGFTGMMACIIALVLSGQDPKQIMPTLVLFAGAATRLMPAVHRIISIAMSIRQSGPMVENVYRDLNLPQTAQLQNQLPSSPTVSSDFLFKNEIEFQGVTYKYHGAKLHSLENVSFKIPRGASVAFVGPSGSGKTTLVDCLLGLLPEVSGKILVDGRPIFSDIAQWRRKIGYIPQQIYLSDDTFKRNIAFGVDDSEIDEQRVWAAIRSAKLDKVVAGLPNGLDTFVGERGARISGGQRQRVGIARALYLQPEVLILDEATSALDNETEYEITRAVEELSGDKTVVVIAHRLSTVARCDQLFFMLEGKLSEIGKFDELVEKSENFRKFANIGELSGTS